MDRHDRTRPRRLPTLAVAGALAMTLTGCGDGTAGAGDDVPATVSPPSAPSASGTNPVAARYIAADDLPGRWRASNPPGAGFGQQVCGVDMVPHLDR